jgi:transposase
MPREGHRIRLTMNRANKQAAINQRKESSTMNTWQQITHFVGFDWAKDHHDLLVLDGNAQIVGRLRFDHSADGWQRCRELLAAFPKIAVAVEAGNTMAIEQLLALGCLVFSIHPRSSKSYRQRRLPTGSKTDEADCLALANALRMDGQAWKPVTAAEPSIQKLRLLCRDEVQLIEQRTALVNQLQQALYEYYPTALAAFDDWTIPPAWAFIIAFPTPQALVKAGKRKWQNFLHVNRLWQPEKSQRRLAMFAKAMELRVPDATIEAKSALAVALATLLRTLENQIQKYRTQITQCFQQHPNHALFETLPGAGAKIAPRLLAELSADPGFIHDPTRLQSYAGMTPVSYQSGQVSVVYLRRQCNRFLRATVHLWVDLSRRYCDWAQIYYRAHRRKGQSHACALRCLGVRWLKILCAMLRNKTPYNGELHARNQLQHGSWVLQLQPAKTNAS